MVCYFVEQCEVCGQPLLSKGWQLQVFHHICNTTGVVVSARYITHSTTLYHLYFVYGGCCVRVPDASGILEGWSNVFLLFRREYVCFV